MATAPIANIDLTILDNNVFAIINPFHDTDLFWYPLKTSENQNFSDTFRGTSEEISGKKRVNHSRKQHIRANQGKIYNELIKTIHFQNTSKEHLHDRINVLIIQGEVVNKPNRNDDSYRVNQSIVDFNMEQLEYSSLPASDLSVATPNTKQSSSIESVNTPKSPSITYQRLTIYLQRILIAKNLSEELSNYKHSMTTHLKKWKLRA